MTLYPRYSIGDVVTPTPRTNEYYSTLTEVSVGIIVETDFRPIQPGPKDGFPADWDGDDAYTLYGVYWDIGEFSYCLAREIRKVSG